MLYSEEQIQRANGQSISDYFRAQGYSCTREGREIHIHGFGGFKVREDTKEYYIHSEQKGGIGLVDCLRKTFNMTYPEAVKEALNGEMPNGKTQDNMRSFFPKRKFPTGEFSEKEEKKEFKQPQRDGDNKRVFAYLTKTRGISSQVVNELIAQNLLYQDIKGNAVFLDMKDGKPCGAEFHGTGCKRYFIGNADFSEIESRQIIKVEPFIAQQLDKILKDGKSVKYAGCVYATQANIAASPADMLKISDITEALHNCELDIKSLNAEVGANLKSFNGVAFGTGNNFFEYKRCGDPAGAYVFESAIDMMSFMHLHPEAQKCEFVSMGGLKPSVVESLLERGLKVALCVDNDGKGKKFQEKFADRCIVMNECAKGGVKDYNELLLKKYPKKSFIGEIHKMSEWAEKVQERAALSKETLSVGNRNRSLEV